MNTEQTTIIVVPIPAMIDFALAGLSVAVAGILFIALIGWRMVPARKQVEVASFDTGTCPRRCAYEAVSVPMLLWVWPL